MQDTIIVNSFITEASRVADPGLVHGIILARLEAIDMPIVVMNADVTTTRTAWTDRLGLLEKPDPNLEPKIFAGQGSNRTDINGVPSVRIVELFARKGGNLCRVTALKNTQLVGLRNLFAEPYTTGTQNTTFRVKDHVRAKVHDFTPMHLLFLKAAMIETILHVIILQPAFPCLVADGAIQRMIDEQEFEYPAAAFDHLGRIGEHHHVIRHWRIAGNFQLGATLQLDETHTAIPGDAEFGVIAIVRNSNTGFMRRLDNRGVVACRNFLAVNRQLFCHGIDLR